MDDREKEITEQLAGRYEIIELLGRGGFASVYRVRNVRLHRTEALKILSERLADDSEFGRRFEQEARVAASLDHPNIVKIYDFGGAEAFFWFSMQLVEGPSLGRRLKNGIRLDAFTAARIGVRVLDALRYSHERDVIHRDIKPDNILIDREGRPYLTDFGVAKSQLALVKTQAGTLLGSPAYMSPEQLQGRALDGRSDLYSVGVTLYKALSGELPFSGEDTFRATMKRLSQPPTPLSQVLPGVDPTLEQILMRSLEREPADRFADAADFCGALEQFLADAPREDQPIPVPGGEDATLVLTPTRGGRAGAGRTPTASYKPSGATPRGLSGPSRPPPFAPAATGTPAPAAPTRPHSSRIPGTISVLAVALALVAGFLLIRRPWLAEGPLPAPQPTAGPTVVPTAAAPTPIPTEEPTAAPAAAPTQLPPREPTAASSPASPSSSGALGEDRPASKRPTPPPTAAHKIEPTPGPESAFPRRGAKEPPQIEQTAPLALAPEITAKHRGESVGLSVTVAEDGTVKRATVISEVCPECDLAALEAAKRFRFKPARDAEGRPVEATMALSIRL
jgi:serine/threonine-protein kinase